MRKFLIALVIAVLGVVIVVPATAQAGGAPDPLQAVWSWLQNLDDRTSDNSVAVRDLQSQVYSLEVQNAIHQKMLDEVVLNQNPWYGLQAAADLWNSGDHATGKALGVYAVSQLVGSRLYGCHGPSFTDEMYLRIDADTLSQMLLGSPYQVASTSQHDGTTWITFVVNNPLPGC